MRPYTSSINPHRYLCILVLFSSLTISQLAVIMANAQNESIWAKAVNCGDVAQCYKWKDIRMAMGRAAGWKGGKHEVKTKHSPTQSRLSSHVCSYFSLIVIGSDSDIVKIDPFFPPIDVTVIVTAGMTCPNSHMFSTTCLWLYHLLCCVMVSHFLLDRAASLGWKPQQLPLLEYSEHYCEVWKAISES